MPQTAVGSAAGFTATERRKQGDEDVQGIVISDSDDPENVHTINSIFSGGDEVLCKKYSIVSL